MQDVFVPYEEAGPLESSRTDLLCVPRTRTKVNQHLVTMFLACGTNTQNTWGLFKLSFHLKQGLKHYYSPQYCHDSFLNSLVLIPICTLSFNLSRLMLGFHNFFHLIISDDFCNVLIVFFLSCCNAFNVLCKALWIVLYMKCFTYKYCKLALFSLN